MPASSTAAPEAPLSTATVRDATDDLASFFESWDDRYRALRTTAGEAEWALNTRIVPGDTSRASATQRARLALARFAGAEANVAAIRRHLRSGGLSELDRRRLDAMLRAAAESPEAAADLVEAMIGLETRQVETLFGFDFRLDGRPVSTNELDRILRSSDDLALRERAWTSSKEVGAVLRPGVLALRDLRNGTVGALGYDDFFDFKADGYDFDGPELFALVDGLVEDIWPLYRELHTWARHELAERYAAPVPDHLPAHWLPDRWGQDWSPLVRAGGNDLDAVLSSREPEWIVREAERFYRSLGLEPLPDSFWDRSSLYPAPPDAAFRKNNHASAWHVDLERDVRALMSVESDGRWYETTHHELGHIYYYLAYATPEVPVPLRAGANRAFHEAIGSLLGFAATQDRFLAGRGLRDGARSDDDRVAQLLREALRFVPFMPWSAGVMTRYEAELYTGSIDPAVLNRRWWELKREYQGIVPPAPRDERHLDAASKTHITNDPAEYYDYAISHAILFQLHDRIANDLLGQDPHDTDYFGSGPVGDFLLRLMRPGATRSWQELLEETTGERLDGRAMAAYFAPLMAWLRDRNEGRRHSLPARAPRASRDRETPRGAGTSPPAPGPRGQARPGRPPRRARSAPRRHAVE